MTEQEKDARIVELEAQVTALIDDGMKSASAADEAEAACAAMCQLISDFVHNVKHAHVPGWGDVSQDTVADQSFKELSVSLSTNCGKHLIDRLKEAEWLLANIPKEFDPNYAKSGWTNLYEQWLQGGGL